MDIYVVHAYMYIQRCVCIYKLPVLFVCSELEYSNS